MSINFAFVGDIHGNLHALRGIWGALVQLHVQHVVFLGDYINRGPQSADVLEELILVSQTGRATLLAGNHETALLDALERQDLGAFLKMGGAMTIRSYVGGPVGPDVLNDFVASLNPDHLAAMQNMPLTFETDDLIAQHVPPASTSKFRVSAHVAVGEVPRIDSRSAQLDTGCGGIGSGRLTALLWPSLDYVQVNTDGELVTS